MQYVRSLGGSVSKTWNSINPATLSGAIDVIVVEQADGSLACSPFHVRFGKFSLLRPYEKKVEFMVNHVKQPYAMKLGEGGEAFFVFETSEDVPESQQTSPVISPAASPRDLGYSLEETSETLQEEPEFLDLNLPSDRQTFAESHDERTRDLFANSSNTNSSLLVDQLEAIEPAQISVPPAGGFTTIKRSASEEILQTSSHTEHVILDKPPTSLRTDLSYIGKEPSIEASTLNTRSISPPLKSPSEALERAKSLSLKLSDFNVPSMVMENGDLMLDMTGFKSREEEALRAEVVARRVLAEEFEGHYDIGALIGADEQGNIWIYRSEDAKNAALGRLGNIRQPFLSRDDDATSDPGHQSDDDIESIRRSLEDASGSRKRADSGPTEVITPPENPQSKIEGITDSTKTFAKTLRLTSEQLLALQLKNGPNSISFSVNRATCHAYMYFWRDDAPIVISDIDGTITKSDALGHVLNMIGRDWTHLGVAKLYTDIVANGYHILYLTSRSVGQADTTRTYLNGVMQEGFKLPKGPVIMSPDRTMAALRREIYLRNPEAFKMSCLRDIRKLFGAHRSPFYAGFGNRLTDALSYRAVNIPSTRIFTINTDAEVSLDLLSFNKYKSSYVTMREIVDHFFPPVGLLMAGGDEGYTDFNYWRAAPIDVDVYLESSDDQDSHEAVSDRASVRSEDEGSDGYDADELGESHLSYESNLDTEKPADILHTFDPSGLKEMTMDERTASKRRFSDTLA